MDAQTRRDSDTLPVALAVEAGRSVDTATGRPAWTLNTNDKQSR